MAKRSYHRQMSQSESPAVADSFDAVEETPAVDSGMVRVISLRPGPVVTSRGVLECRGVMEMPSAEAHALITMFPEMIQIV